MSLEENFQIWLLFVLFVKTTLFLINLDCTKPMELLVTRPDGRSSRRQSWWRLWQILRFVCTRDQFIFWFWCGEMIEAFLKEHFHICLLCIFRPFLLKLRMINSRSRVSIEIQKSKYREIGKWTGRSKILFRLWPFLYAAFAEPWPWVGAGSRARLKCPAPNFTWTWRGSMRLWRRVPAEFSKS